ncbi:hypothetical protein K2173_014442 [Erythroxylum novogranatense]|uniref:Uncharacterized protein n=1 Tax=Erythroxylum novogranatense TaxID=1862640 RepID=A0AAV8S4P2_9ROSI|nr:hypothetical protein K2173_014442 [Erythroxylum novogranatense]
MSRWFSYNRVDIDEDEAVSESLVDSWLNIEDSSDGTDLAGMKTEGSVSENREVVVGLAGLDKESTFGTNQNEPMNPTGSFVSDQQQTSSSSMVQTSVCKEHITWSETEKWESNPQSFFQFETEMDIPIETSFGIISRDVNSSVSRQEVVIIQASDNTSGKFETSTSSGTTDVTLPTLSSLSEAIFQLETGKVVSNKQKVPSETDQDVSNKEVTEPNMVKQCELLTQLEKHPRASKQQIVSVLVTGAGDHTPSQQRVNNLEIQKYEPREQENSLIVREPYGSYQSDPLNHREEEICGLKKIIQKTLKEAKARLKQQFKVKPESINPTAVLMPLPVSYRPPSSVNMEGTETNDEDPGAPPKRTRIKTLFAGESHLAFQIPPNYKKFEEEIDDVEFCFISRHYLMLFVIYLSPFLCQLIDAVVKQLYKKEMEYKSDDPKLPPLLLFAERVSGWIVRRQQRTDGRFDMDQGSARRRWSSSEELVVPNTSGNLKLIEYVKSDEDLKHGWKRKAKNMEIDGKNDYGKMDSRIGKNKGSEREQRERSTVTGGASVLVSDKVPIPKAVAMEAPNPSVSIFENSKLDPGNYSQGIYNGLWDLDTAPTSVRAAVPTSFRAAVDVLSSHFSLDDDDDN